MRSSKEWYRPDCEKMVGRAAVVGRDARRWARYVSGEGSHVSIVKWLHWNCLLDVTEKDIDFGRNTAHWSACNGHESVLAWIFSVGLLDVKDPDDSGMNVIQVATYYGCKSVLDWLQSTHLLDSN